MRRVVLAMLLCACGTDTSPARNESDASGGAGGSSGGVGGASGTGGSWPGGSGGSAPDGSAGSAGNAAGAGGTAGAGTGGAAGQAGCSTGGAGGAVQCGAGGACEFPQGVPDGDYIASACSYGDTDPAVDAAVNAVMATLTGCNVGSDCPITVVGGADVNEICQNWFSAVTAALRAQNFCAGQHAVGSTDEIAVSNTCCEDKWYGYHVCNYGGGKVVWNPGARRGWWMIAPSHCGS